MKAALGWILFLGATAVLGQEQPPPDLEQFTLISARGVSRPAAVHHQAVGWVLKGEHHHVSVSAHLGNGGGRAPFEAYLMKRIGEGATRADEIASTSFDLPYPFDDWVELFTDLDLGPGEYWLIIAKPKKTAFSSINWFVLESRDQTFSCETYLRAPQSFTFQSDAADYLPASKFERKLDPYLFQFEVTALRPRGSTDCP